MFCRKKKNLVTYKSRKYLAVLHSEISIISANRKPSNFKYEIIVIQENLAKMLNIDRSFFSYIESGKRGCSVDLLVQLSELFGVSLDYLILGSTQDCVLRRAEFNRLKADMENLIIHLEMFKSSLEEM